MRTSCRRSPLLLLVFLGAFATAAGAAMPFVTHHEAFYSPVYGTVSQEAWFVRAADLDGDGRDELITGMWDLNTGSSILTVRRFGPGVWDPSTATTHVVGWSGWTPGACEVADLNDDGLLDLAVPVQDTLAIVPATSPGTFGPPVLVPMPGIGAVAIADFDHDGIRDVAAARYASDQVQIWRGTGSFSFVLTGSHPTHNFPWEIAVVDLDGNVDPDLVVAADTVSVALLGDGTGGFIPHDIAASRARACGDLDGDGNEDLLAATSTLLGNGDGTFQAPQPFLPALLVAQTADLDEDGRLDLVGRRQMTPNSMVSVQRGFGNGQFGIPEYPAWWACQPSTMAIGDFDGDGHLDVGLAGRNAEPDAIYYGRGNGSFFTPRQIALTSPPLHVVAGTLGGDTRPDLVVTSLAANSMSVLLSNGLGSWSPPDTLILPGKPGGRRIAVADLDGDGRDDIVAGYSNLAAISVWLTQPSGLPGARTDLVVPTTSTGDLQIVDLDKDLVPDILWVQQPGPSGENPIHWFRGLGGGAFAASQALPISTRWAFAVGDLNGDGIPDITCYGKVHITWGVLVAIASSPGVFPPPTIYPWLSSTLPLPDRQIVIGDFDGDVHADIALPSNRGVLRLHGVGGGSFGAPSGIEFEAAGGLFTYCEPRDLDGDGVDELVSAAPTTSRLRLLQFEAGGDLVSNPMLAFSAGGSAVTTIALPDVDGNGTPDIVVPTRRPWLDLLLNRTPPEVLGVRPPVVGASGLALAPLADPARETIAFRLASTHGASVRLELLDLQGRRIRSTIVRPNPGAATTVSFGKVTEIPAGLYFVRARQGAGTATTRISVVH